MRISINKLLLNNHKQWYEFYSTAHRYEIMLHFFNYIIYSKPKPPLV